MKNAETITLDINQMPDKGDKEGWSQYAKNTKEATEAHYQSGELSYPTLGQKLAVQSLKNYVNQVSRMDRLHQLNAPEVVLNSELEQIKKRTDKLMSPPDHEKIAECRGLLDKMPQSIKNIQNQIFTSFVNHNKSESNFILETIKPGVAQYRNLINNPMAFFLEPRPEKRKWYDFIGKLTKRDDVGQPVISDRTFVNFFEWYQANLARAQKELNQESARNIKEYSDSLKIAVSNDRLPKSLENNLSFFEPTSPKWRNLNFSLFDTLGNGSTANGVIFQNELIPNDPNTPIGIRADVAINEEEKYPTISHELTHAISGDRIIFGGNKEATRIINEALTEHISHIINISFEHSDAEEDDFAFMTGNSYEGERKTIKDIAVEGETTIPPQVFYEAYAEYDPEFDGIPKPDDENEPIPKTGPKKQALYDALFAAYPDCKTLDDLGGIIVEKFQSLENSDSK